MNYDALLGGQVLADRDRLSDSSISFLRRSGGPHR